MTASQPPALPAGFAARPDLTGITVTVSCWACSPARPCDDCLSIRYGDGPRPVSYRGGPALDPEDEQRHLDEMAAD